MSRLAQRYATAVFQAAEGKDAIEAVAQDLDRLGSSLRIEEVAAAVQSPDTTGDVREQILAKLMGDAHDITKNLVAVVLERHREAILPEVASAFSDMLLASRNEVRGTVETAHALDESGLEAIAAHATKLVGKTVHLDVEVNEDLIGGIRLRIGNTLYDGSVATVLADLERSLIEAAG